MRRTLGDDVVSRVVLVFALTVLGLCFAPNRAQAYAWMIRHGENQCVNCHADPSGGELLTRYGRQSGLDLMRMPWRRDDAPRDTKKPSGFLWGLWDTPRWLLLGGALRLAGFYQNDLRVFPMQADLYGQVKFGRFRAGGSMGVAKVEQNSDNGRAAFVTRNQGDQLNLVSRTHWVALDLGQHNDWTLRAGRMNLPFGLRVPEHYLWTRDVTRTDRDSDQQHGVALAYNRGALRSELMAIAGNYQLRPDRYRERGYSGFAEYAFLPALAVGASSLITSAHADRTSFEQLKTLRGVHGAFLRARVVKPVVVLAEFDVMHSSRRALGYTGFVQVDYEPLQGLHVMCTAELLDQGKPDAGPGLPITAVAGAGQVRPGGWFTLDWFFYSQLDLRVDVIARQDAGAYVLAQLHTYL
ncbi:MAG TPA: hypothetical protein VI299_27810 [Polyangiales bacterium]